MSLISYISSHFNRHRTLPQSLKTMRVIAIAGIAVATTTLIVTLSILKGFEREYKRTILDFNAHVVLLEAGEVADIKKAESLVEDCHFSENEKTFVSENKLIVSLMNFMDHIYDSYSDWQSRASFRVPYGSFQETLLNWISPKNLKSMVPNFIVKWKKKADELKYRSVVASTQFIYREGLAISHGAIKGVIIKGVDTATFRSVNPMQIELASDINSLDSALNSRTESNPVIIGTALAKNLKINLEKGDHIKLLVPTSSLSKTNDNFEELKVVGTFESGLYDYDAQFILMSNPVVRKLFNISEGKFTGIELKLDDPEKAASVSNWLEQRLPSLWSVVPWNELNADIFKAVEMEKRTFSIIMGMLVIVSAFNIIGVLVLIILMRMHEISVLRSLGMTQVQLKKVFTRGGLVIGFTGVTIGLILGVVISLLLGRFEIVKIAPEIYFLSRLPVEISPVVCALIAIFCIGVCWLTSRSAAGQLSKVPISEGLSGTYQ